MTTNRMARKTDKHFCPQHGISGLQALEEWFTINGAEASECVQVTDTTGLLRPIGTNRPPANVTAVVQKYYCDTDDLTKGLGIPTALMVSISGIESAWGSSGPVIKNIQDPMEAAQKLQKERGYAIDTTTYKPDLAYPGKIKTATNWCRQSIAYLKSRGELGCSSSA